MSYDISPSIQLSFNDPLTGFPAAGGYVFFYVDINKSALKPVYALGGTPGSYTYVPYEANPDGSIALDSSGSFNPQLYLYPYDQNGNVEKYYIEAYSSTGGLIYQTENFPDVPVDDAALTYLVTTSGISPANINDPTQVAKAVENYSLSGDFFVDSSDVPNVYVAERASQQNFVLPTQLVDGMKIRLIPSTTNTGASTFTFIENTSPIVGYRGSTTALTGGQIVEDQDLWLTYDLANTNWYICPNNADYVSAGDYYRDTGSANNYVALSPHNPQFSNPSELFSGAEIKFFPEYTNTGASTLTFLGETLPIKNVFNNSELTPGQIIGAIIAYSVGYRLQFNEDNLGVRQWFLVACPASYSPVVIQKVVVFQNLSSESTTSTIGGANSGALLLSQEITPKSTGSTIKATFTSVISEVGGSATGGWGVNLQNGDSLLNKSYSIVAGTSGSSNSVILEGCVSNTTGNAITFNVYYGVTNGGTAYNAALQTVLTIEEII